MKDPDIVPLILAKLKDRASNIISKLPNNINSITYKQVKEFGNPLSQSQKKMKLMHIRQMDGERCSELLARIHDAWIQLGSEDPKIEEEIFETALNATYREKWDLFRNQPGLEKTPTFNQCFQALRQWERGVIENPNLAPINYHQRSLAEETNKLLKQLIELQTVKIRVTNTEKSSTEDEKNN